MKIEKTLKNHFNLKDNSSRHIIANKTNLKNKKYKFNKVLNDEISKLGEKYG